MNPKIAAQRTADRKALNLPAYAVGEARTEDQLAARAKLRRARRLANKPLHAPKTKAISRSEEVDVSAAAEQAKRLAKASATRAKTAADRAESAADRAESAANRTEVQRGKDE